MSGDWGPLAALAGEWEGVDGFDTVFARASKNFLIAACGSPLR